MCVLSQSDSIEFRVNVVWTGNAGAPGKARGAWLRRGVKEGVWLEGEGGGKFGGGGQVDVRNGQAPLEFATIRPLGFPDPIAAWASRHLSGLSRIVPYSAACSVLP